MPSTLNKKVVSALAAECRAHRRMVVSHDHFGMVQSNPSLAFVLSPEDRQKMVDRCKADRKAVGLAVAATDKITDLAKLPPEGTHG